MAAPLAVVPIKAIIKAIAGFLAVRFVALTGLSIVTFVGLNELLQWGYEQAKHNITQLPHFALQLAGLAQIDIALNVIVSAYTVNLAMMASRRFR